MLQADTSNVLPPSGCDLRLDIKSDITIKLCITKRLQQSFLKTKKEILQLHFPIAVANLWGNGMESS